MECVRGKFVDGDPLRFDPVEGSNAIQEWPGVPEWRGRFWLPDSSPVQAGGKFCLIPDDRHPAEPIVEGARPRAAGRSPLASRKA